MTAARRGPVVVVKIGGSLLGSRRLEEVLDGVIAARAVAAVIVPGGGLFADAVREAQALMRFDDRLAHRLALDAMDQLGEVLAAGRPGLAAKASIAAFAALHAAGRVPVWSPAEIRDGHPGVAESWSVTSDSLALWLANETAAAGVVLVKSVDAADVSPAGLAAAGVVDAAFAGMAEHFSGQILVAGPASDLRQALLRVATWREPVP